MVLQNKQKNVIPYEIICLSVSSNKMFMLAKQDDMIAN